MALICRMCKQDFVDMDLLEAHLAQDHFQHLPFSCTICPQFAGGFFPTEYIANKHVALVHGQQIEGGNQKFTISYHIREDGEAKRIKIRQALLEHCSAGMGQQQNVPSVTGVAKKESYDSIPTNTSSSRSTLNSDIRDRDGGGSGALSSLRKSSQSAFNSDIRDGGGGALSSLRNSVQRSMTRSMSGFSNKDQGCKVMGNPATKSSSDIGAVRAATELKAFQLDSSFSSSPLVIDSQTVNIVERAVFKQLEESMSPQQWVEYAVNVSGYDDMKFDPKILQEVANPVFVDSTGVANCVETARAEMDQQNKRVSWGMMGDW